MLKIKSNKITKVAIACDHVGVELKLFLKEQLSTLGIKSIDAGTYSKERVDYPDYAKKVANLIISKEVEYGILICGTGVGMSIAANKINGIRAVVCSESYSAVLSREHNNSNILALGARVIGMEVAAKIMQEWLLANYKGERHQQRIDKISQLEDHS